MSIISQTDQNTMELLAKVASLEDQVVALQASEAKLTAENEKLKEECDDLQKEKFCLGFDEDVHEIVDKKYIEILKVIADKSKALTDDAFKATDQLETELKIAFRDMNKVKSKMVFFEKLYKREKKENEKIKDEHKKFDEIWKTECITEQDIIDMKRQISDQCDLIKELKAKNEHEKEAVREYHKLHVADTYICGNGICKGKTYEEAKRIIIDKEGYEYWELWRKRVNWEFCN